jgi:hypothetical protein
MVHAEIYEVEYSCSPGGIDCWEINLQDIGRSQCYSDFLTAGEALDYLVKLYPTAPLVVSVQSLAYYHKKELLV